MDKEKRTMSYAEGVRASVSKVETKALSISQKMAAAELVTPTPKISGS